jgi:hypothetical protein
VFDDCVDELVSEVRRRQLMADVGELDEPARSVGMPGVA